MKMTGKQEQLFRGLGTAADNLPGEHRQEARRLLAEILKAVAGAWTGAASEEKAGCDEQDHE